MKEYHNWSPRNYQDIYHGTVTVREALEQSMNSASVRIGLACGIESVIRTARTLGVQSDIPNYPATLLGAVGIPPIEMADAFSTIPLARLEQISRHLDVLSAAIDAPLPPLVEVH